MDPFVNILLLLLSVTGIIAFCLTITYVTQPRPAKVRKSPTRAARLCSKHIKAAQYKGMAVVVHNWRCQICDLNNKAVKK